MNSHKALLALPLALFICATANATGLPEPKAGVLEAAAAADVSRAIYADFLQNLDNKGVKLEQEGKLPAKPFCLGRFTRCLATAKTAHGQSNRQ